MTKSLMDSSIIDLFKKIHFKRKYPHVSLYTIFRVYTSAMINSHSNNYDKIIRKIISNIDHIESLEMESSCSLTIKFDNGNSCNLWVTNLWYSFLSRIVLKYKKTYDFDIYNDYRPSRRVILEFLEAFHKYLKKDGDSLVLISNKKDNQFQFEKFFNFENTEEK